MAHDALFCAFDQVAMGESTENYGKKLGITREEQDEFSARSHERAAAAMKEGRFDAEIVPVPVPQRKGDPVLVTEDEGVRPGTTRRDAREAAPRLRRRRHHQRRLGLADLRRRLRADRHEQGEGRGARPRGARRDRRLRQRRRPRRLAAEPAQQRHHAGARQGGPTAADLDLVELNEAFAQVGIQSARELGLDADKVNVDGGAIALGHPVGMSGARIVLHLALELKRRGGGTGAAALCGGGGQGFAMLLKVPATA